MELGNVQPSVENTGEHKCSALYYEGTLEPKHCPHLTAAGDPHLCIGHLEIARKQTKKYHFFCDESSESLASHWKCVLIRLYVSLFLYNDYNLATKWFVYTSYLT